VALIVKQKALGSSWGRGEAGYCNCEYGVRLGRKQTGKGVAGRKGLGKKRQMLQKHPASKLVSASQAWANMDGSDPSTQGLMTQQVVQFCESFLEKENPYHGMSPLPDIFLPHETRLGFSKSFQ